ncbi:hypothetical protein EYF80_030137 [Liparis tanakae]|uniref:Secreted protein n=1 Tax=Liparis tanakae TaxID=230148 RepID=A0A4Z2H246_9TELE|nr:hypothetical protein EYF80_030137 [Liparis tanakae]
MPTPVPVVATLQLLLILTAVQSLGSCASTKAITSRQKERKEKRPTHLPIRLYSLRLSCRMVSLTAAKTKRMFSVSVAHVKWE